MNKHIPKSIELKLKKSWEVSDMYIFFYISVIGIIAIIPVYFLSLEHSKFQEKYGKAKGLKLTTIFGMISGWFFFIFLFGIWISPQPTFIIPLFQSLTLIIPVVNVSIPILHMVISIPLISFAMWYGIIGVKKLTLKVAETHRPEKIVNTGIYSKIRHPQYFGAILAHLGFSILLSSLYSVLSSPFIIVLIYIISWKEEKELLAEFGQEYEEYKKKVPMLVPKIRSVK
ncbi:MAG: methyltransferase family protein [Promethearchaeota archaeon]|jgi:protein-S-isoprenylcysteine O-methyltransferase Ste14